MERDEHQVCIIINSSYICLCLPFIASQEAFDLIEKVSPEDAKVSFPTVLYVRGNFDKAIIYILYIHHVEGLSCT